MWLEPLHPPLRQTQSNADFPSSRSKLLKPALKWCLTGPGPPLSARRLQAASAATELHPGAGPNGRRTRALSALRGRGGQLGPSASPSGHPPPKGRELSAAAPPRPHLPAPLTPAEAAAAPAARLLAGSLRLRRRQESPLPLAEAGAPPSAKTPPIGPGSATAATPHAGHVDYPTARRSANQRASADAEREEGGRWGMCAGGWRRALGARDAARGWEGKGGAGWGEREGGKGVGRGEEARACVLKATVAAGHNMAAGARWSLGLIGRALAARQERPSGGRPVASGGERAPAVAAAKG